MGVARFGGRCEPGWVRCEQGWVRCEHDWGRCEQGHEQGVGIGVCSVCGQEVGVGPGLDGLEWGGLQV